MSILKTKNHSNSRISTYAKNLIKPKNIVSLNLLIDRDLHREFKIKATCSGLTMSEILTEMIQEFVK